MARALKSHEKLAKALAKAKEVERESIVKGSDLDRTTRETLQKEGWLLEIIRNWYLLGKPRSASDKKGSTSAWYGSFWPFVGCYLADRFGDEYCLSAESSVDLYSGDTLIPPQVIVLSKKPSNQNLDLLFNTSIFMHDRGFPEQTKKNGTLRLMKIEDAIAKLSANYYEKKPDNAEIALRFVQPADISRSLLNLNSPSASGRLIGAYRHLGKNKISDLIEKDSIAAGLQFKISNPFVTKPILLDSDRLKSPYSGRIKAVWLSLREQVIDRFPQPKKGKQSIAIIENIYEQDAYHSLSIEGYQVTMDLIKKIAIGDWRPEVEQEQLDAMAAKGYYETFKCVVKSIQKTKKSRDAANVFSEDLSTWYRELFSPLVKVGLMGPADLAGYRVGQVLIKGSRHIPPPKHAIIDAMETLFELLAGETEPCVRAVLGHYMIGFIHPYIDGNGRIARFLMNLMLVSGGYNWTVIRVERRIDYLDAMELVTTSGDITAFVDVITSEMEYWRARI